MSSTSLPSTILHKKGFHFGLQPPLAWTAILGLVFCTAVCILVGGASSILRLAFPLGSLVVGVFLYWRYPVLYIGFTWWMWFLTPLVARLVDYRSGWDPQRLILVSPFLVTLIAFATFLKHLPGSYRQGGLPFILAVTSVIYAFCIGIIQGIPLAVFRSLLDWLTPVLFGFHLFLNWRDYPKLRQNFQRTFLWGVLIIGAYGLLQYLIAPEWDRLWLIKSEMTSSSGTPEPFGIRVWSTMHNPGAFGTMMTAGLLLLFSSQGPLNLPASGLGYLSFLLSLTRSNWGSWFVGLLILINSLKSRLQMRIIITIFIVAMCVFPLVTIDPFAKVISSRIQTISHLQDDTSYHDRSKSYDEKLNIALSSVLGNGIGNAWVVDSKGVLGQIVLDSGILDIFFTLGWVGAFPYLGGLILILLNLIQYTEGGFDIFMKASCAISISTCGLLVFYSAMIGPIGIFLWGFLGISMAAHKYYQHTSRLKSKF